jgi:hypothetical protein
MARSTRALVVVVGAIAVVAAWGGPRVVERIRRTKRLETLLAQFAREGSVRSLDDPRHPLLDFDEPEALLALIDLYRKTENPWRDPRALRFETELFALEPGPLDSRPADALRELTRDLSGGRRFWALYLLAELARPRHAREPAGFAPRGARIHAPWPRVLDEVRSLASVAIETSSTFSRYAECPSGQEEENDPPIVDDTAWRALVRIAQCGRARVVVEEGRVRFAPVRGRPETKTLVFDDKDQRPLREMHFPRCYGDGEPRELSVHIDPPLVFYSGMPGPSSADEEKAMSALGERDGLAIRRVSEDEYTAVPRDPREYLHHMGAVLAGDEDGWTPCLREALLECEGPDAFLAVLASADEDSWREPLAILTLFERVAATSAEPSVRAAAEKLAREGKSREARFVGQYLSVELASPTFPAPPPGLASAPLRIAAETSTRDAIAALGSATGLTIVLPEDVYASTGDREIVASPWWALLEVAQRAECLVRRDGARVVLEKSPREHGPKAEIPAVPSVEKGERALAALEHH